MNNEEKALSYEEAKILCRKAFDAGASYGSTSMQYGCNAVAYDWEHWLGRNEDLFRPKPTVEDVLAEFALACEEAGYSGPEVRKLVAEYAEKLRLAGDGE